MPINIMKKGERYAPTPKIVKSRRLIKPPTVPDIDPAFENIVENMLKEISMPIVIKTIPEISLCAAALLKTLDLIFFLAKVSPPSLVFLQTL